MPAVWPSGSTVVRLDSAVQPLAVAPEARGLDQHYRIGPASLPLSDPAYTHVVRSFDGRGLRPYAPVHLRAATSGGDLRVSWVRRSRVDGDSWLGLDVPLGEAREAYLVRVTSGQTELRMVEVNSPEWTYTAAMQATDGATGSLSLHVAQLSDRYGPGPETRIEINV